jgi:putative NAD(P)-binding protein
MQSSTATTDRYDLCIVGAGYAGLNAAFVASQYLPATSRVLILDKHQQAGGMWNDAYPYVRLHQPYQMFTAGNITWSLGRERSYLATRDEVAAHLRYCLEVITKRLEVDARWGWEYLGHTEDATSVRVSGRDPAGKVNTFTAARFIDARSFDVEPIEPLRLASRHVHSIAPQELDGSGLLSSGDDEAVWVIGSGKTAMDTVIALVRANSTRHVGMVSGTGTFFLNRDLINPTGPKRWIGGKRYGSIFAGAAKRFDGTNAAAVGDWCRAKYGTSALPDPAPTHTLFAFLSQGEMATVANGVSEIVRDHLVDVVDDASGPVMVLRTSARHPIPADSWVVNCTGYLRPREIEHVPYVSHFGRAMSLNATSTPFVTPGVSAFLLSHLFFLDKLAEAPIYELDFPELMTTAPEAALAVVATLVQYNLSLVMERVPLKALRSFGLDLDRWYPLPRQLAGQLQLMRTHKRDRPHHRHALDTFSQHSKVRCGLLSSPAPFKT